MVLQQQVHDRLDELDEVPTEEAKESLDQLQMIEANLDELQRQYKDIQATQLTFQPGGALKLAYDAQNKPFHTYQESLQQLLLKLDSIPSHNDTRVRSRRKAIVLKIQNTMDMLDNMANVQKKLK